VAVRRRISKHRARWLLLAAILIGIVIGAEPRWSPEERTILFRGHSITELRAAWTQTSQSSKPRERSERRRGSTDEPESDEASEDLSWKDRRELDRLIEETTRD